MANGIRTGDPRGFNKRRSSKFRVGSQVRQTPEEGWRIYRPKRCGNINKDEGKRPKTLNDKKSSNFVLEIQTINTDSFVVSQLFSWARHAGFSKMGSKTDWLFRSPENLMHRHKETKRKRRVLNTYVSLLFCLRISA